MISSACSIETFVEAVKDQDAMTVIAMAVDEATKADRLVLKNGRQGQNELLRTYSRQLKQLIAYHRYAVKPRRPEKTTYRLYMKYWGPAAPAAEGLFASPSGMARAGKPN